MKHAQLIKFIPGIAWFFVVLFLLCMPGSNVPTTTWFEKIHMDKLIHAGVFGLLAVLFMLPVASFPLDHKYKIHYFIRIAIATSIWGLTTEFIQRDLVIGRSFDLMDWAADSLGAAIAFVFCLKKYARPSEA